MLTEVTENRKHNFSTYIINFIASTRKFIIFSKVFLVRQSFLWILSLSQQIKNYKLIVNENKRDCLETFKTTLDKNEDLKKFF